MQVKSMGPKAFYFTLNEFGSPHTALSWSHLRDESMNTSYLKALITSSLIGLFEDAGRSTQ
jgi:hypothetical protein